MHAHGVEGWREESGDSKQISGKGSAHGEKCREELKLSRVFTVATSYTARKTTSLEVRMLSKT